MKQPVAIISHKALRQFVREAMGYAASSPDPASPVDYRPGPATLFEPEGPVEVCDVVDVQASRSDPSDPNFSPQNSHELGLAMKDMVDGIDDDQASTTYKVLKKALSDAQQNKSVQSTGDDGISKSRHPGDDMKDDTKTEAALRSVIRGTLLREFEFDDLVKRKSDADAAEEGEATAEAPEEATESGDEDLATAAEDAADDDSSVNDEVIDGDDDGDEATAAPGGSDEETMSKDHGNTRAEPFPMAKPEDAEKIGQARKGSETAFEDIAKEMGMSVAGAKQAVDKALARLQFLMPPGQEKKYGMEADELEIMVLEAMQDYVEYLQSSGDLTDEETQLMLAHPEIMADLEGFREFTGKYVRRAAKLAGVDLDKPFGYGSSNIVGGRRKKKDGEEVTADENDPERLAQLIGYDKKDAAPKPKAGRGLSPEAKTELNKLLQTGISLEDALKQVTDWVPVEPNFQAKSENDLTGASKHIKRKKGRPQDDNDDHKYPRDMVPKKEKKEDE